MLLCPAGPGGGLSGAASAALVSAGAALWCRAARRAARLSARCAARSATRSTARRVARSAARRAARLAARGNARSPPHCGPSSCQRQYPGSSGDPLSMAASSLVLRKRGTLHRPLQDYCYTAQRGTVSILASSATHHMPNLRRFWPFFCYWAAMLEQAVGQSATSDHACELREIREGQV